MPVALSIGAMSLALAGCAHPDPAIPVAAGVEHDGRAEEQLSRLSDALQRDPDNVQLRVALVVARDRAVATWLLAAERLASEQKYAEATALNARVLKLDPDNARARASLLAIERAQALADHVKRAAGAVDRKDDRLAAQEVRSILAEDPDNAAAQSLRRGIEARALQPSIPGKLSTALEAKLSLDFKDATLSQIFEVLSKTSNVNFVFDKDLKTTQKGTLFLKDTSVKHAIEVLLLTNQLEQRIVDNNTILIYPNTPAKAKDYQELSVRTFFVESADVELVANTMKTILKTHDLIVDKKQNMIIMRDTPDAIRLAEKLVALHDLPEPEATLDVEILEINRDLLTNLGIAYPESLSLTPLPSTTGGTLTLGDLLSADRSRIGATISPLTINANATDSDVKTLANPRIRVRNRETAKILVGDRVPNITTTSTATGFVAESVQYIDVGLKLEVTPTVTIDNEVAIKIALEVSNIASQITTNSGTIAYQISTRNASTVLRLKNGENQILAGLINNADRHAGNSLPWLGKIPVAGLLFGSKQDETSKDEIVLSITPRIIRNVPRPDQAMLDFRSGTDTELHAEGVQESAASDGSGSPPTAVAITVAQPLGPGANGTNAAQGAGPLALPSTSPSDLPFDANPSSGAAQGGANAAAVPGPVGGSGLISTTAGSAASPLSWQGSTQIKAGTTFALELAINEPQPVTGMSYVVSYDPTSLSVVNVAEGDFLKQNGANTAFTEKVDPATGQIAISDVRAQGDATGVSGPGTALTVTFRAIAVAPSTQLQVTGFAPVGPNGTVINAAGPAPLTLQVSP